jgi:hypothetical protein
VGLWKISNIHRSERKKHCFHAELTMEWNRGGEDPKTGKITALLIKTRLIINRERET